MHNIILYESIEHKFIALNESDIGEENGIRSNQYLIMHKDIGVLLDPGGFNVMPKVLSEMLRYLEPSQIKAIILSHQDPDIVAGINVWIDLIDSPIYVSQIWKRFLPHYGLRKIDQFVGVPDQGMTLKIQDDFILKLIPAHFLHSEGQINTYDPIAKILFSGDIGAAVLPDDKEMVFVDQLKDHMKYIEWFHKRYMCSNRAIIRWVELINELKINMIAPQHGPIYRGAVVADFIEWFKNLECGIDLMSKGGNFSVEVPK